MRSRLYVLLTTVILAAFLVPSAHAVDHNVTLVGITFVPATLEIAVGDKVIWTNPTTGVHTVTSGTACTSNGTFDSGFLFSTDTFSYTFETSGDVPYFCIPHCGLGMTGEIKVGTVGTEDKTWGAVKALYSVNDPLEDLRSIER